MANMTKDSLKQKISEKITDTDLAIELLEDIDDSMDVVDNSELEKVKSELEKTKQDLDNMKEKYKARFTESIPVSETKKEPEAEGLSEEKYVDIKDIFY